VICGSVCGCGREDPRSFGLGIFREEQREIELFPEVGFAVLGNV
jgi:hypothetical protein